MTPPLCKRNFWTTPKKSRPQNNSKIQRVWSQLEISAKKTKKWPDWLRIKILMKIEIYGELEIGLMITSPNVYLYFKIFTNTGQIVISMVLFDIFVVLF